MRSRWVRTKDRRGAVIVLLLSSHVKVGEDEAWAKRCCHCIVVAAGMCRVAGMQTCTAGTHMIPAMACDLCRLPVPVVHPMESATRLAKTW